MIFKPAKAHRENIDYTREAETLYRKIALDFGLEIIKKPDDPVELSMVFPKQPKLNLKIWVCLQNLDELWFVTDFFTCSMFPFEEVKDQFNENLRGFLSGNYRIRKFVRTTTGQVRKSLLQKPTDSGWKTVSTYGITFLPNRFYQVEDEFVRPSEV